MFPSPPVELNFGETPNVVNSTTRMRQANPSLTHSAQILAGEMSDKKVIFVLGPPGVGKGTQCRKIADQYNFVHISAGELLRKERRIPNSRHGKLIDSCIRDGCIVRSEITCKLLQQTIMGSSTSHFLIDGFPRNQENREGWYKAIGDKIEVLFVLLIDVPNEICIERCLKRGAAGGTDRSDDSMEVLEKRIAVHIRETRPTLDYFSERGLLKSVDGSRAEDEVFQDIRQIFDQFLLKEASE